MKNVSYISKNISNLKNEVISYLNDAGIKNDTYNIEIKDNTEFLKLNIDEKYVDFILTDIIKTKWYDILKVTKYKNSSVIFIFKF